MKTWLQKVTKRRRHRNGWVTGYRTGEWWIGARRDFWAEGVEFCFFGLSLFVPNETRRRNR